jgi:hypothetical protein
MSGNFYMNLNFSGAVVLENIFRHISQSTQVKMVYPIVIPPDPGDHDLNDLILHFVRKIFLFDINTCRNVFFVVIHYLINAI